MSLALYIRPHMITHKSRRTRAWRATHDDLRRTVELSGGVEGHAGMSDSDSVREQGSFTLTSRRISEATTPRAVDHYALKQKEKSDVFPARLDSAVLACASDAGQGEMRRGTTVSEAGIKPGPLSSAVASTPWWNTGAFE